MSLRPLLLALLLSVPSVASAQGAPGEPLADGVPPRPTASTDPVAATEAALASAAADFAACGFETSLPADALAPATLHVVVSTRGRAGASFGVAPAGAPRALLACLVRVARRAVARVRPRFDAERAFDLRPFESLPSMAEAPPAVTSVLDDDSVTALTSVLGRIADEDTRLARLERFQASRQALPLASAVRILGTFRARPMRAAVVLCRLTAGDDVAGAFARRLPARQRGWFIVASAGRCGVAVSASQSTLPLGAQCATAGDCVLACRHPPDCCGGQCGCGEAAPVAEAARLALACEARTEVPHCPPVACAYRRFTATCVEGRCVAESDDGRVHGPPRPHPSPIE